MKATAGRQNCHSSDDDHRDEHCASSEEWGGNNNNGRDTKEESGSEDSESVKEYLAPERMNQVFWPEEEYLRLKREGHCFRHKIQAHLSSDRPKDKNEPIVEARAVHFSSRDDNNHENTSLDEAEDNGPEDGKAELQDCSTDEKESSESSEEELDEYSDSSEEYYI
ncbi:hypothetical protein B0H10DRAFT_1951330 [Mycena sp. CBHHK59/15]|nr:hypothetical protein B0H10DRAFT_1951330 [Mycena sp. CBHHK59/15]